MEINWLQSCRIGRLPPVVRTAVPVDGRFEHVVLSCHATTDHAIVWIERESQKALDVSASLLLFNFVQNFQTIQLLSLSLKIRASYPWN